MERQSSGNGYLEVKPLPEAIPPQLNLPVPSTDVEKLPSDM